MHASGGKTAIGPGRIQVYTGDGKGKTTAAAGLACRALGQGLRVLWVRMLKPATTPAKEVVILERLPGFAWLDAGIGVIDGQSDPAEVVASVHRVFNAAQEAIAAGRIDLAIFDEINGAVKRGALPLAELLDLLDQRPAGVELVLTGRAAHPEVLARADLVTAMTAIKHPLHEGIAARQGIDY